MQKQRLWYLITLAMVLVLATACGAGAPGAPSVAPADEALAEAESDGDSGDAAASETEATEMGDGNPNESPVLWDDVAAGELPPLAERLPANPRVLEPLEEIGTYGGTLRRGSAALNPYLTENFTREPLTMWEVPLTNVGPPVPNLAESWEYNDDGTAVTGQSARRGEVV